MGWALLAGAVLGCATATEGDESDTGTTVPADTGRDVRDFDFGPDPFMDTGPGPTPDAGSATDAVGGTDSATPTDTGMVSTDSPVGSDTPSATDASGCPSGLTDCGGGCVDTRLSSAHCGRCNRACAETESCAAGVCSGTTPVCTAPQQMCGSGCVDVTTSTTNCGSCGNACSTGTSCMMGRCTSPMMMGCAAGSDDCDMNPGNGCELMHAAATTSCMTGDNLGSYCGDQSCGTLCPGTSWHTVATRTDTRSHWFRARANECSICVTSLTARITLTVPAGIDYDLFVYRPCGTRIAQSVAGVGARDQVTLSVSDSIGSDESFDYFIEVRYVSGMACGSWSMTLEARSTGPSNC